MKRAAMSGRGSPTSAPNGVLADAPRQPKLLEQMREALRSRHYSRRIEQAYCMWA